jgi:hypothetical protein
VLGPCDSDERAFIAVFMASTEGAWDGRAIENVYGELALLLELCRPSTPTKERDSRDKPRDSTSFRKAASRSACVRSS